MLLSHSNWLSRPQRVPVQRKVCEFCDENVKATKTKNSNHIAMMSSPDSVCFAISRRERPQPDGKTDPGKATGQIGPAIHVG